MTDLKNFRLRKAMALFVLTPMLCGTAHAALVGSDLTPNVNVVNTPTVKINSATPVSVRDADYPARHPFRTRCSTSLLIGKTTGACILATVPAGKVLVIETASAWVLHTSGQLVTGTASPVAGAVRLDVGVGSANFQYYYLSLAPQGSAAGGNDAFAATLPLRIYADPEAQIIVNYFFTTAFATVGSMDVILTGYLVDATP